MESNGEEIPESRFKVGDVFSFQAGEVLPADAVLSAGEQVVIDEFDLTGELLPVAKAAGDALLAGTTVVYGKGTAQVTAAGADSEYGRVAAAGKSGVVKPDARWWQDWPAACRRTVVVGVLLLLQFVRDGEQVVRIESLVLMTGLMAGVFALGWTGLWQAAMRSWLRHFFERSGFRLLNPAVLEQLGEIDVCCFDKTGILTSRHMAVGDVVSPRPDGSRSGPVPAGSELFQRVAEGCAFAHQMKGNQPSGFQPIDEALWEFGRLHAPESLLSIADADKTVDVPFIPANRYSVVSALLRGERRAWLKGAPEAVLPRCRFYRPDNGVEIPITGDFLLALRKAATEQFEQGKTVIALAEKSQPDKVAELTGYCFLGLIILENPLRPEAAPVIRMLAQLGIRSLILTGDTPVAAAFAGKRLGIVRPDEPFLSGPMIERMGLADITAQSRYVSLFARLTPSHKGLVVEALKRQGRRVLVIGDGANDSIALRVADIGVSLQSESSPLARRNADILIREDLRGLPRLLGIGQRYRRWTRWQGRLHGTGLVLIGGVQLWGFWRGFPTGLSSQWLLGSIFALAAIFLADVAAAVWITRPAEEG